MLDKYSYDYEYDLRYCYPNGVLKNKLGIKDSKLLHIAEREITSLWLLRLKAEPVKGCLDFTHMKRIHRRIFSDIYTWAGKSRTVDISKGNIFCRAMYIDTYSDDLFSKLKNENYLLSTPKEDISHRLAYYLSEINVLHPFREGNGRVQRLFIEYLASINGYHVDFSEVSSDEMIMASADAFARDYDKLNDMLKRICSPISNIEQEQAIGFFFGVRSQEMKIYKSTKKR